MKTNKIRTEKCPRCGEKMKTQIYSIDSSYRKECSHCGYWEESYGINEQKD